MVLVTTENLGEMVRFHRKRKGLTQMGLASVAGVGKTMVFDLEKGKKTVKLETLMKVLRALEIDLVGQSPYMESYENKRKPEASSYRPGPGARNVLTG